jgi:Domain of unknown function (DUF4365)
MIASKPTGKTPLSRKKPVPRKKRRTREHVIADLSANHVERHALLAGYTAERRVHDYGIDLILLTYDEYGNVEVGEIKVQLKATDHLKMVVRGQMIACRIERADLRTWLHEPMPVILVMYDASTDTAFWLYVQEYFQQQPGFDPDRGSADVTVRIPRTNVVNAAAMEHFAHCRNHLLAQMKGLEHYHEE